MGSDRWADVDLARIEENARSILGFLPEPTRLVAVVKAGAYGHGALPAARAALKGGAEMLAVSTPAEAAPVQGLGARILAMGGLVPEAAPEAVAAGCELMVHRGDLAAALGRASRAAGVTTAVHLKVDTGMGRLGASPAEAPGLAAVIAGTPGLRLAGTMTHLASAGEDAEFTRRQHDLFDAVVAAIRAAGVDPGMTHANNTAGARHHPERSYDAVRAGIGLYDRALTLRAQVTHVKTIPRGGSTGYGRTWVADEDTLVATIAIGYADGVMRARSNRGHVLIRGCEAPLLGRVSMDAITVDARGVEGIAVGDAATLIGRDGDREITADEVAAWSGTISYEVFTALGPRVERRYPRPE